MMNSKILMYHSVGENDSFFTTSIDDFTWQISYLRENNFKIVTLEDLLYERQKGIALTFDDGYLDNFTHVLPMIKKYNFPISIFLPTNFIGSKIINSQNMFLDIMSEKEIGEMIDSGLVTFYPHGHSHRTSFELNDEQFEEDVKKSQEIIGNLNGKVDIFCFPKGKVRDETKNILKKLKVEYALGVEMGDFDIKEKNFDKYKIKRIAIDSKVNKFKFKIYMSQYFKIYLKIKELIYGII